MLYNFHKREQDPVVLHGIIDSVCTELDREREKRELLEAQYKQAIFVIGEQYIELMALRAK